MLKRIKSLLYPEKNEYEADRRLVLAVLGVSLIATILLFSANISPELVFILGLTLVGALILALRGNLQIAGIFGPLGGLIVFTLLMFRNFGIRDTAILGLPVIIVAASLMNGQKGAIVSGVASLMVVVGLGVAEFTGLAQNVHSIRNTLADYLVVCVIIVLTVAVEWAVIGRLRENIRIVHRELTERQRVEDALRQSEERYRNLLENIPAITYIIEMGQEPLNPTIFVGPQIEKLLGYASAEFLNDPLFWTTVIHPDDRARVIAESERVDQTGEPFAIDYRVIANEHKIFWFHDESVLVKDDRDQPLYRLGVWSDITKRKLAEDALRESEERYRTMVETFPDIIMLTNLRGEILFVNSALENQTGYTLADFQTYSAQNKDFIHPEDIDMVRDAIQDLLTSDKLCTDLIENRFIDKSGQVHWYSGVISKVQYQGELVLQTVTRDITARKQAEELTTKVNFELQRRLKELYVLNAVAQAGASAKNEDEMLTTVVERLYSSLYTDIIAVGLWDEQAGLLRTHPSAHRGMPAHIRYMTARLGDGVVGRVAATHQPYRIKDTDDPLYLPLDPVIRSELCVPILAGEKLIGVLDVESKQTDAFSDADEHLLFTIAGQLASALERLRAEQQLRSLNAELEQRVTERTAQLEFANKELEAFSYSVSHDLRAPLRAIYGFSKILNEDFSAELSPPARSFLQKVLDSGRKMGQLIDGLLDFSRIGRKPLVLQDVAPASIVRTVIDALPPETADRQIEWILPDLPPAKADPLLLQQVYVNLIGNAVKYTSNRQSARIEVGSTGQDVASIYFVRDNGAGFDMQYADKLFGVFQRLHRDDEFEGSGIGLATVKRIVERHGGKIWVEAGVDKGATFYFTLG